MRKKIGYGIAIGAYLFVLLNPFQIALPKLVFVNMTESLPRGIYLAIPGFGIRDGDIVAFAEEDRVMETIYQNGWMKEGDNPAFVKYAALAGSRYSVDAQNLRFKVNGKWIGMAYLEDGKGHSLTPQFGAHQVEEGRFLPYTYADRSYDGRYTGTISMNRIYARVIPLVTI